MIQHKYNGLCEWGAWGHAGEATTNDSVYNTVRAAQCKNIKIISNNMVSQRCFIQTGMCKTEVSDKGC